MPPSSVRAVGEDELDTWFSVVRRAMLGSPPDEEGAEERRSRVELDRLLVATDGEGAMCGTAAAFGTDLTVPGGTVPAGAVTGVGVLPTHRRRGHLGRLMQAQLSDIAGRGEPVAVLVAAEYPIYARYGYGPATEACQVRIDAVSLAGHPGAGWFAAPTGTVEMVENNDAFAEALADLHERARRRTAGHIRWREQDVRSVAGLVPPTFGPSSESWPKVLWRDDAGQVQGAATYNLEDNWERNRPRAKLTALPVVAVTDEALRELVRYLTDVDWVGTVNLGLRPVDDPVPLWLHDGRAAALTDRSDHVWARVMDVPAALSARRYQAPGRLVLQVEDPAGFAGGRYLLETEPDGDPDPAGGCAGKCIPTGAEADLTVPVTALGSAYLGGFTWSRLAATGSLDEHTPGAVARASAMFTSPRAPWCPLTF